MTKIFGNGESKGKHTYHWVTTELKIKKINSTITYRVTR